MVVSGLPAAGEQFGRLERGAALLNVVTTQLGSVDFLHRPTDRLCHAGVAGRIGIQQFRGVDRADKPCGVGNP